MNMSPTHLLPEAILFAGAVLTLLVGSFLPQHRLWLTRLLALLILTAASLAAAVAWATPAEAVFAATFAADGPTSAARVIITVATIAVITLGKDEITGRARESETHVLLLLAALGSTVLAGANDLLVLAVGFLLSSIPLYALVGMERTALAAEGALKTYLIGALMGIALLLGATVLFGVAGTTGYGELAAALPQAPAAAVTLGLVAVLGGLTFKMGAVPGHFWISDAAQGSSTTVAAFLTTVPKIGAVMAAYRLVDLAPDSVNAGLFIALLAAVTMTLGNLAAFTQTDPRRLLGWSTVSQAGYLLLPVAVAGRSDLALPSMLLYLAGYAVSNLSGFAVIAASPGRPNLSTYRGLAASRPWVAGALLVALLSLVGTPPTAVFAGKLTTFTAAWDGGLAWLVIIAAVNTVASLFYYLRWLAPAFRPAQDTGPGEARSAAPARWAGATAVATASAVLALGLAAPLLWTVLDGQLAR
ncbi:NADH-quinone oxidoreductase subunit N [Georgenia satyanarayanai]|nr:NADH-quinone oxidoreductase subunit N [Georgenia satyanarayanai]